MRITKTRENILKEFEKGFLIKPKPLAKKLGLSYQTIIKYFFELRKQNYISKQKTYYIIKND